jgi:hypothetical protein
MLEGFGRPKYTTLQTGFPVTTIPVPNNLRNTYKMRAEKGIHKINDKKTSYSHCLFRKTENIISFLVKILYDEAAMWHR